MSDQKQNIQKLATRQITGFTERILDACNNDPHLALWLAIQITAARQASPYDFLSENPT